MDEQLFSKNKVYKLGIGITNYVGGGRGDRRLSRFRKELFIWSDRHTCRFESRASYATHVWLYYITVYLCAW